MIPLQQSVFSVVPPTTLFCSPNIPIYLWNKDMITPSVHYEQQHYPLCTTGHAILTTTTPPPTTKTKKIDSLLWFASIATSSSSLSSEMVQQPHDGQQKLLLQSQEQTNSITQPKSKWRKYRQTCKVIDCTNQVVKGGVCIRHGASRKLCSYSKNGVKCTSYAHKGGVCTTHGAKKKRCSSVGCTNQARKRGLCLHHGAYKNSTSTNL